MCVCVRERERDREREREVQGFKNPVGYLSLQRVSHLEAVASTHPSGVGGASLIHGHVTSVLSTAEFIYFIVQ